MKIKYIAAASLIPLNTLLLFLLIAGEHVVIPAWLQVFGRMHPLFLHFPIVLILLYVVFVLAVPKQYKEESWYTTLAEILLLSAAFTASVTAPIIHEEVRQQAALEDAFVYADLVEPILQKKCMGCHNSDKSKGELAMDTRALLLKGGKDGKLWDTTKPDMGILLTRIHLPEE